MFKRQKQPETPKKPKRKLTDAEKREIRRIMEQASGDGKPHSAQDTLPFRQIYPDGLCKLDDTTWSRCIEFADVNYQLAQPDDQTAIFEALCDMYNAHDSSIGMEITLPCHHMNREDFVKRIEIAAQGDDFDDLRELYTQMLRCQLEQGNNGLVKSKLLILTIEANDIHSARAKFSRIVLDTLNHFKTMGALAKALDGREWLELLHGILHPDGERFSFDWDWLAPSGLHVKDFIAPSSFRFGAARRFQMGTKYCAASFLQITAPEMDDRILAELLDTDSDLLLSIHIRSMDQNEAIKTVKRKITDIDSMKIDAQKRAAREGFDMDIIPTDIATYAGEAKNILRDLQSRNERMFLVTFLLVNMADSKRKLGNDISRASSVAQKYNCQLTRLDFQQEQGFVSALPLGVNQIKIQRGLTTSALAIMMPFTTQEIFQGGDALYYGLNATSGNMILADRKQNKTPNGLILGTPGSGKSFSAKRSILNVFLITRDDIIICDPEAEYFPLVHRLHGQVIKISPTSRHHANPMDINLNYSEDDNPLALKSDFILSFCELAAGGRNGLEPVEKTLIDRAVRSVYRPYIADPKPENMMQQLEENRAAALLVKDLSRLGRNYIEVGRLMEEFFPEHNIRLVAVSDNIDTDEGENEMAPIRNLFNEWYARDISKKRRISNKIKGNAGEPMGQPPYGYMKDPDNPKHWIIDEEAALVVRRIYSMYLDDLGTEQIATILDQEGVLIPRAYWIQKGIKKAGKGSDLPTHKWFNSTVVKILTTQEYCGDVINFKTYSKSYKNKKRIQNDPESMVIFKDVHEPIIERAVWEQIQEKRGKIRKRKTKEGDRNMFCGILVCADCGHNLNFHFNQGNHDIKYFNCSNYNSNSRGTCTSTHYIRVDFLEQVVLGEIKRLTKYAVRYENDFLQAVIGSTQKAAETERRVKQKELASLQTRDNELDGLFERIYEDSLSGKLSDERYAKMSRRYEDEQAELSDRIKQVRRELEKLNSRTTSTDHFLSTVRQYTRVKKLTPRMLNELIDRIEVHQAEKIDGEWVQKLTIHYNCIGALFIPDTDTLPVPDVTVNTRRGVYVTYEPAQNEQ